MILNIFRKKAQLEDPESPFSFRNEMILYWSPDSEGWISPIPQLNEQAEIYIGPEEGFDNPADLTCELVIEVLKDIENQVAEATQYLLQEILKTKRFKEEFSSKDLKPTGLQIFEHEKNPQEYSLTFDPIFDSGAIYKVRLNAGKIIGWSFDD